MVFQKGIPDIRNAFSVLVKTRHENMTVKNEDLEISPHCCYCEGQSDAAISPYYSIHVSPGDDQPRFSFADISANSRRTEVFS
jgi:hypothetical protein